MSNSHDTFSFSGRIRSGTHALRGIIEMLRSQHNAWVHAVATFCVIAAGGIFGISNTQWCLLVLVVTIVWVGYDDNTPIGLSGARAALPIWIEFMKGALAGRETRPFDVPAEGIVFVEIDKETGLLATPHCPKVISESFIPGTEPQERCSAH